MKNKFEIVSWDWKDKRPYKLLAKFQKKYKHSYETNLGSDCYHVFFSDFIIKSEKQASKLYCEYFDLDNE